MGYALLAHPVELFRGDSSAAPCTGCSSTWGWPAADKVPLEAWYNISTSQFISHVHVRAGRDPTWWDPPSRGARSASGT